MDALDVTGLNRTSWKKRFNEGLTTLPEGETKKFMTETFITDWNRLENLFSTLTYDHKPDRFINLLQLYLLHPVMVKECHFTLDVLAKQVWSVLEVPSENFRHSYQPNYLEEFLQDTAVLVELFSQKKGYNLWKEINRLCISDESNRDIMFCQLAPVAKVYDKIEDFIETSMTESDFNIIRTHILLTLPQWDPLSEMPPHFLDTSTGVRFEIYTKAIDMVVDAVKKRDLTRLKQLQSAFPSVVGCTGSDPERCLFEAVLGQLANYVQAQLVTAPGEIARKTIYADRDHREFLSRGPFLKF